MRFILLIIFLFFFGDLAASTIRVGAGRVYKSIGKAIEIAEEGDTILVDAGHYKEKNLFINIPGLVLKGIGYPVLDGQNKIEIITIKADRVVVDGFKLINSGVSSLDDLSGIKVYESSLVNIRNNILENTFFGIYLSNTLKTTVENNRLTASSTEEFQSGNGIHCWKSDSLKVIGNTISGHRDGIYFEFVKNSVIWRNISKSNLRYGLHFMFSDDDMYVNNVFRNNGSGVSVMYSNRIKIFSNYFEENWGDAAHGILLKEISDGFVEGNYFMKNTSAVYMEGANRIYMKRNVFENNGWALKIQASCSGVVLELNNFIGNTFDVGTNGSLVLNQFKNNYWDKYEGYDLNKDSIGDIPYRPVSMYSMIVEKYPPAMILFRSFITSLLDKTEKILPSLTPENLKDSAPMMKKAF